MPPLPALALSRTCQPVRASVPFPVQRRGCGEHRLLGFTPASSSLPPATSLWVPVALAGGTRLWSSWELKQESVLVPVTGMFALVRALVTHGWARTGSELLGTFPLVLSMCAVGKPFFWSGQEDDEKVNALPQACC